MAKLFRKGRFQFFAGKGFGQYLLYILLEMSLVVAGILIALAINNRSERAKNEVKAKFILEEVRRDLKNNLTEMESFKFTLEQKDSLIRRVMQDSVSREDYRSNFSYAGLSMTYASINFQKNGFANMTRQSNLFNRSYDAIFTQLETIYQDDYQIIESMQERWSDLVISTIEQWAKDFPWMHKLSRGEMTEEALDYFCESPFYLNSLDIYRTYTVVNILPATLESEVQTALCLVEINKILEPEVDPYQGLEKYFIRLDEALWAQDTGTYSLRGMLNFKLQLTEEGIYFGRLGSEQYRLYPKNDTTLSLPGAKMRLRINRDKQQLRILGQGDVQVLDKVLP